MVIAIDFDDTLTKDSELWREFIRICRIGHHKIICVTCRRNTAGNQDVIERWMKSQDCNIPVYFSNLNSKLELMNKLGIKVDIWIDDDPRCILEGKR